MALSLRYNSEEIEWGKSPIPLEEMVGKSPVPLEEMVGNPLYLWKMGKRGSEIGTDDMR